MAKRSRTDAAQWDAIRDLQAAVRPELKRTSVYSGTHVGVGTNRAVGDSIPYSVSPTAIWQGVQVNQRIGNEVKMHSSKLTLDVIWPLIYQDVALNNWRIQRQDLRVDMMWVEGTHADALAIASSIDFREIGRLSELNNDAGWYATKQEYKRLPTTQMQKYLPIKTWHFSGPSAEEKLQMMWDNGNGGVYPYSLYDGVTRQYQCTFNFNDWKVMYDGAGGADVANNGNFIWLVTSSARTKGVTPYSTAYVNTGTVFGGGAQLQSMVCDIWYKDN